MRGRRPGAVDDRGDGSSRGVYDVLGAELAGQRPCRGGGVRGDDLGTGRDGDADRRQPDPASAVHGRPLAGAPADEV
jgi:hypothetical protein